ncbi:serine/threonine protein kinase [Persicimonas caeni]|uniref:Serine/threonine protein kinase n=1 Tax=Persicimonas caeni TaxID=2292766 RepID=A0A4Y6PRX6_PERCE|nr:serine/threonine-protein kinase [Persicimonas caeni]QDG50983.1 serine/threonine protein kinase [Persicimonas caeni]QED32204.1 serine/threonine protein kinase [Persicimonas caeni]
MTTRPQAKKKRHGTQPLDAPQSLVGRVLDGRYRLVEVLSRGGMGIVFEAVQLSVNRKIAVKILRPTLSNETDLVQRFSQEIEVVASLRHPHVVSLIDAGRDAGGLTYLAMEYVEGQTFRQALKTGELSLPEILDVLIQTCDALMEAHDAGIIHRDLKFDNIMLSRHKDERLHIKILDFGVAKLLSRDLNLTRSGQVPGTPGIIAPELIDERPPTPRSDLYSLGVLLYTALCGEAPFTADNDLELMRAHKFEEVPRLEERINVPVPPELLDLTYTLLEKLPQHRPESAQQVRDRLEVISRRLRQNGRTDVYEPTAEGYELRDGDWPDSKPYFDREFDLETGEWEYRKKKREDMGLFERFARAFFGDEPVVAPTTVVVGLALLLFILLLALLYMVAPGLIEPFFQKQ